MPRPLSIAVGLLLMLALAGVIGWWLVRCLKRSDDPARPVG